MADWYVAPDGVVDSRFTYGTIGAGGYGHSLASVVRWSEFKNASGAWVNRGDNDVWHMLVCAKAFDISNGSGWTALLFDKVNMKFRWESPSGIGMRGSPIRGTRDWPWPKAGQTAVYGGEIFGQETVAACAPIFEYASFEHLKAAVEPNAGSSIDIGHAVFNDCYTLNVSRGLYYTESRTDGRSSVEFNRCAVIGFDKGNARTWANNDGLGIVAKDSFFDSEHQNDNSSFNSASTPSAWHIMDSNPVYQTVKSPIRIERCVMINCRAGYTGSSYPQGDGGIAEENVGSIVCKDVLTYGNGDRGIDLKCAGYIIRHTSFGDGYALGHHLDTIPVEVYSSVYYTGARLTASGSPPSVACVQASGWTRLHKCWLSTRPTAAQTAFNNFAIATGSVDPHKWQSQVYGGTHQGHIEFEDCYERVGTSTGATETVGFAGTAVNGRVGAVFGLAASTTYQLKVRGLGPDGAPGPYTSLISATTSADGGGERVAPAAPVLDVPVPTTGGLDCTFSWSTVAEDAGTSIQGYIMEIDFGDGNGFIPMLPGKSASPLTLSGFQPASGYTARVRAFDANMNLGTPSNTQAFTTSAGSVAANTPSVPLNVAVDPGWIAHVTAVGIGHTTAATGFTAPASGAVSIYEIRDNADVLKTRMGSIRLSAHDTPVFAKTNVTLVTV